VRAAAVRGRAATRRDEYTICNQRPSALAIRACDHAAASLWISLSAQLPLFRQVNPQVSAPPLPSRPKRGPSQVQAQDRGPTQEL
jgi:hypothetical protein